MAIPAVHRVMGKFMQLPQDHVNAFVVELERSVIVIDSTLAISSARDVRKKAESFRKPIDAVLLTHGHPDHYSGLVVFKDLPILASQGTVDFAHREDIVKSPVARQYLGDDYAEPRTFPNQIVRDGDSFTFSGTRFTYRELGPGESDDDGMWVFEDNGVKHAFVGDAVAKACHCFCRDYHVDHWLDNLDRLEREFDFHDQLYFGHGAAPAGLDPIHWQRGYNLAFLRAVEELLELPDRTARPAQERVIARMKEYLPTDATLFLLDYELGAILEHYYAQPPREWAVGTTGRR